MHYNYCRITRFAPPVVAELVFDLYAHVLIVQLISNERRKNSVAYVECVRQVPLYEDNRRRFKLKHVTTSITRSQLCLY